VVGTLAGNASNGTWSAPSGAFTDIIKSTTSPTTISATYTSISSGNVLLTITTNTQQAMVAQMSRTATVNVMVNQPSIALVKRRTKNHKDTDNFLVTVAWSG
jgi:hypothetical protein